MSGTWRYIARRVVQIPLVILCIALFNFILIHTAPGDPAAVMTGEFGFTGGQPTHHLEEVRAAWGLNYPLYQQLFIYLGNLAHGNLGYSFAYQQPVLHLILVKIPPTLLLLLTSEVFSIVVGTTLGTVAARRYGSRLDTVLSTGAMALNSVPVFWSGLLLILIFVLWVPVFPASGMYSAVPSPDVVGTVLDVADHLVLPALTLSLYLIPFFLRVSRASVIEIMNERFMLTARSKGFSEDYIFFRHALPNAILPVLTLAGVLIGTVFSGAVLIETIFGWPGMGSLLYNAIFLRDYPLVMGILLVASIGVVAVNLMTDLIYAKFDPRVSL